MSLALIKLVQELQARIAALESRQGDEYLTVEEAALALKVDPATVQRELKGGRLPGNKVGRAWRIRRADLREHLKGGPRVPFVPCGKGDE
mgnify:CR=1 FL=1